MKLIEKTFAVELTEKEIEVLTTALHGEYMKMREEPKDEQAKARAIRLEQQNYARILRSGFASLIGRMYMGQDA